jgi:hypothetical protein
LGIRRQKKMKTTKRPKAMPMAGKMREEPRRMMMTVTRQSTSLTRRDRKLSEQ